MFSLSGICKKDGMKSDGGKGQFDTDDKLHKLCGLRGKDLIVKPLKYFFFMSKKKIETGRK